MDLSETVKRLKVEILFGVALFAFIFSQIQQVSVQILLSMLLITIWIIMSWYYLQNKQPASTSDDITILENENEKKLDVPEISTQNYYVKSAPKKGLKYLKQNDVLIKIA